MADNVDDLPTGGIGQPGQLLEIFLGDTLIEGLQGSPHEHCPFDDCAVVDELSRNEGS